jgi:hypothetical protein
MFTVARFTIDQPLTSSAICRAGLNSQHDKEINMLDKRIISMHSGQSIFYIRQEGIIWEI